MHTLEFARLFDSVRHAARRPLTTRRLPLPPSPAAAALAQGPVRPPDDRGAGAVSAAAIATLVHELRNAIAPVENALQVIGMAKADPEIVGRMGELAQRQVQRMSRLINDLLEAGRVANGKLDLEFADTTVQVLVNDAVRACSHVAVRRHHTLTVIMPKRPLPVRVDALRSHQVLVNVLGNAIKYTVPGGRIEVRVRAEGARASVSISDTGIGIEPAQLERVFELFQQEPRARALCAEGMGIGLAVARRLAEMQGGSLSAASPGKDRGSTFTMMLPVREKS